MNLFAFAKQNFFVKEIIFPLRRTIYKIIDAERGKGNTSNIIEITNQAMIDSIKEGYKNLMSYLKNFVQSELKIKTGNIDGI